MAKKKAAATARDLIVEIRKYSEKALSAAEDLQNLEDESVDADEVQNLYDICEHFDSDCHTWMDDSEAGKKVKEIEDAEDAAETPLAVTLRHKYFKANPTKDILPSQIAKLDKKLLREHQEKKAAKKVLAKKK